MRIATLALLVTVAALPAAAQPAAAQPSPPAGTAAPPTTSVPTTVAPATPATPTPRASRQRRRGTAQQRFDAANTTHDGKLTLDQAKAANMTRVVNNFDAMDSAKKGYVTVEDIRAYGRAQRAARRHPAPQ